MFSEDQLLPLSALQHLLFCPRQTALIHYGQRKRRTPIPFDGELRQLTADTATFTS